MIPASPIEDMVFDLDRKIRRHGNQAAANFLLLVDTITETTGTDGDLGGGRTHNLQLRRLTLYPIELRDRDGDSSIHTTTCQAGWKYEHSIW